MPIAVLPVEEKLARAGINLKLQQWKNWAIVSGLKCFGYAIDRLRCGRNYLLPTTIKRLYLRRSRNIMHWKTHHDRATELRLQAEQWLKTGRSDLAQSCYRKAGLSEVEALKSISFKDAERLGAIVVSATKLFLAAEEPLLADSIVNLWINSCLLKKSDEDLLLELLGAIR
jgi:hypothetical protein